MQSGREQLAAWLRRSKLLQRELAVRLSLTDSHLSQILSGVRRPGLPIVARIEDVCGVPMRSWLLKAGGKPAKPRKSPSNNAKVSTELTRA